MGEFRPKGFFERKFHYERLETENAWSGLGDARGIRWAVDGLVAGIVIAALPFFDWPMGEFRIVFRPSLSWGGVAFSAGGLILAAFSLFMMVRRGIIKESTDNQRLVGRDGDPAP